MVSTMALWIHLVVFAHHLHHLRHPVMPVQTPTNNGSTVVSFRGAISGFRNHPQYQLVISPGLPTTDVFCPKWLLHGAPPLPPPSPSAPPTPTPPTPHPPPPTPHPTPPTPPPPPTEVPLGTPEQGVDLARLKKPTPLAVLRAARPERRPGIGDRRVGDRAR